MLNPTVGPDCNDQLPHLSANARRIRRWLDELHLAHSLALEIEDEDPPTDPFDSADIAHSPP